MFSQLDNLQINAVQPEAETPEAAMGWDHLLGDEILAYNSGHFCGLRPSRKLGNPGDSA